ncbi:MAG: hypothetical protein R3E04_12940 [Sphingobium sp.]
MPLAALLSATAPSSDRPDVLRAQIIFAAQTLIEYQARQAVLAGAQQLFVMVDAVTPQLSRMVDRLGGEGVQVHLVRDMAGLIRQLPRESDILLFADGMAIDQKYVMELAGLQGNALIVAADDATTAHLERVDAVHRWAGLAKVAPDVLFNTLDLIGDWDLVLTIMRAVVQSDAQRVVVDQSDMADGHIALIDRQEIADIASKSLTTDRLSSVTGAGVEHYLLRFPARFAATQLLRMQTSSQQIAMASIATAALGLVCTGLGWTVFALFIFLFALVVDLVSRQLAAMGHHVSSNPWAVLIPSAMVCAGMFWLGVGHGVGSEGLYLAMLCMITVLAVRTATAPNLPGWALITPGSAVLMLLAGSIVGQFILAMMAAILLAIGTLGALVLLNGKQNSGNDAPGGG